MEPATTLRAARRAAGLTLRALADRAGTSHPTLAAYESGTKVPRTDTFVRLLAAAGRDLVVAHRPYDGTAADRDDELVQVLLLAEQFPTRVARLLDAPRFGATIGAVDA